MRLIDADELYKKIAKWEERAREQVENHKNDEDPMEWAKWFVIRKDRVRFKRAIIDAPTVDTRSERLANDSNDWASRRVKDNETD